MPNDDGVAGRGGNAQGGDEPAALKHFGGKPPRPHAVRPIKDDAQRRDLNELLRTTPGIGSEAQPGGVETTQVPAPAPGGAEGAAAREPPADKEL